MNLYTNPPRDDAPDQPYQAAPASITADQVDTIVHCFQVLEWTPDQTATWLQRGWGVRRVKLLSRDHAAQVLTTLAQVLADWAAADVADADVADLPAVLTPTAPVTQAQVDALEALRQAAGMHDVHYRNFLLKHWNVERARALTQDQYAGARQLLLLRQPAGGVREDAP